MEKNEYYYYLHKTKLADPDMIESIFNDGLKSRYHFSINSTMARINENDLQKNGLEDEMMGYLGQSNEYNAVVVIKIPKRYFRDRIHRDGKTDPAVPMFREYFEDGWDWNSIFTPKLIQGIYCRDINKSFSNPNFCPVFDPSGCQFSDEQIMNFDSFNSLDWRNLADTRRCCSFQQLYTGDKTNHVWDSIMSHYSQLYGITPAPMVKYIMPEEDRNLLGEKKGRQI